MVPLPEIRGIIWAVAASILLPVFGSHRLCPFLSVSTEEPFPLSPFPDGAVTGNAGNSLIGSSFYSAAVSWTLWLMPFYSFSTGVKFPRSPFQDGAITGNTGDTSTGNSFYSAFGSSVPMAHFSSGMIVETLCGCFVQSYVGIAVPSGSVFAGVGLPLFGGLMH
jgi:hypothetical protein